MVAACVHQGRGGRLCGRYGIHPATRRLEKGTQPLEIFHLAISDELQQNVVDNLVVDGEHHDHEHLVKLPPESIKGRLVQRSVAKR